MAAIYIVAGIVHAFYEVHYRLFERPQWERLHAQQLREEEARRKEAFLSTYFPCLR